MRAGEVKLKELDQVIMVLREPSSITRRTFDEACAQASIHPRVLLELDSREAVTEAVAAELGVGVVSSVEVSHDPRVVAIPIVGDGLGQSAHDRLHGAAAGVALDSGVFRSWRRPDTPSRPNRWQASSHSDLGRSKVLGTAKKPVGAGLPAMGPVLLTQGCREPYRGRSPPPVD